MAWIDLQNSNRITAINPILLTIRNKAVESRLPLYLTNSLPPEGQAASHLSFIFFDRSSVDRARRKGSLFKGFQSGAYYNTSLLDICINSVFI